jgi:hypothetical protein
VSTVSADELSLLSSTWWTSSGSAPTIIEQEQASKGRQHNDLSIVRPFAEQLAGFDLQLEDHLLVSLVQFVMHIVHFSHFILL